MLLLLLDADVIIDLHRLGIWKHVIKNHHIHIPSIILRREIYYYEDDKGQRCFISLEQEIGKVIKEISCSAEELLNFKAQFDPIFQEEIHDGEIEALTLLKKNEDLILCTCDHAAIKALALLDLFEQGISFENLLKKTGIRKKLVYKHTEKRFRKFLSEGSIMRIQDIGLRKGGLKK